MRVSKRLSRELAEKILGLFRVDMDDRLIVAAPMLDESVSEILDKWLSSIESVRGGRDLVKKLAEVVEQRYGNALLFPMIAVIPCSRNIYVVMSVPPDRASEVVDLLRYDAKDVIVMRTKVGIGVPRQLDKGYATICAVFDRDQINVLPTLLHMLSTKYAEVWRWSGPPSIALAGEWYRDTELLNKAKTNRGIIFVKAFIEGQPIVTRDHVEKVVEKLRELAKRYSIDVIYNGVIIFKRGDKAIAMSLPTLLTLAGKPATFVITGPAIHEVTAVAVVPRWSDLEKVVRAMDEALRKLPPLNMIIVANILRHAPLEMLYQLAEPLICEKKLSRIYVVPPGKTLEELPSYITYFIRVHGYAGAYIPKTREVFIATKEFLRTIVHEMAHAYSYLRGEKARLSKLVFDNPKLIEEAKKVLLELGYASIMDIQHFNDPEELFAEMVEVMAFFPQWFKENHPELYNKLRSVLKKYASELLEFVERIGEGIRDPILFAEALKKLDEAGVLRILPYDILMILTKPVSQLTQHEKEILLKFYATELGLDKLLKDIETVEPEPVYLYQWLANVTKYDIEGVDTPNARKTLEMLLARLKKLQTS